MKKVVIVMLSIVLAIVFIMPVGAQELALPVENASFEAPAVDPNAFPALPFVAGWIEQDLDLEGSTNTGVFANTPAGTPGHINNAHAQQLAFLGSETGNGFAQDLTAVYHPGYAYQVTVGVAVSAMFPPAMAEPADALEIVLYYRDGNDLMDIAIESLVATGLSSTELQEATLQLAAVEPNAPWAGQPIGIALRANGNPGGFWDLDDVRLVEILPTALPVANASFEAPPIDPTGFPAFPMVDQWREIDLDPQGSTNTGVFLNGPVERPDHIVNADANQLAFLGSATGNALEQDLEVTYQANQVYRLTVDVAISAQFPPGLIDPNDTLELVLTYLDGEASIDVAVASVPVLGLSSTTLQTFSLYLPSVNPEDAWAEKPIGIALRAKGAAGGFWDIDNVRLDTSALVEPPTEALEE